MTYGKKLTNKDFLIRLHKSQTTCVAIESYKGMTTKISFKCSKGHIFKRTPNNILHYNKNCPICEKETKLNKRKQQFLLKLHKMHPDYKLLGAFTNISNKTTFECAKHHIFQMRPTSIVNDNQICPKCALQSRINKQIMSSNIFIKNLHKKHPHIDLYSKYTKASAIMAFKCNKCGHIWQTKGRNLLIKHSVGCPICREHKKKNIKHPISKKYREKLTINFIRKLHINHPQWTLISKYINRTTIISIACKHNHIFTIIAENALKKKAKCPYCPTSRISKGEHQIINYLNKHNITYEYAFKTPTCKDKAPLHFDFKIKNILIEYQGEQHYKPIKCWGGQTKLKLQQKHDQIKREWAKNNGYREIEIRYDQDINSTLDKLFNNYTIQ